MTTVIRQPNNWSCTAAVAAMATGTTIEDFIAFVGHDGSAIDPKSEHPDKRYGFLMQEFAAYLLSRGFFLGGYLQATDDTIHVKDGQPYIPCEYKIAGFPAMFTIKSPRLAGCRHVLYWDGETVHDPAGESAALHTYTLLEWWPICRFDEGSKIVLRIVPPKTLHSIECTMAMAGQFGEGGGRCICGTNT